MSYNTKRILTDVDGNPIPQYWYEGTDEFKPMSNEVVEAALQEKVDNLSAQIASLNTKIDNMQNGSAPVSTELSGSIPAHT